MKTICHLLLLISALALFSCAKDEASPQVLKISDNSLHFSGKGGAWQLTVNSNCDWKISGTTPWCTTNISEGTHSGGFIVTVESNDTDQSRTAHLTLSCPQTEVSLSILQDTASGEYHYTLPVVFHILYSDEKDSVQNVGNEVIYQLIAECNEIYGNSTGSVDMNLELTAATEDPNGTPLEAAGIVRTYRSNSNKMSCDQFMNSNKTDASLMWNPNKYINIFVYTFTETNTLGISHLPYTPRENSLPGLTANNLYYTKLPEYVYCISLNNSYILEDGAVKTMAHELGHYLGLLHTFSTNGC